MNKLLSDEDFSRIGSIVGDKHLYHVRLEAEHEMYVVSNSVKEAEKEGLANRHNLLDSDEWIASASEVRSNSFIHNDWKEENPFGDETFSDKDITCEEFSLYLKEKERRKRVAEEIDKKQLKFNFDT